MFVCLQVILTRKAVNPEEIPDWENSKNWGKMVNGSNNNDMGDSVKDKAELGNRSGAKLSIQLRISSNIWGGVVSVFC